MVALPPVGERLKANQKARYPMGNFGFLAELGAARKAATKSTDGNSTDRRHHAISIIAGILLALLIAVGLFILFVTANHF